MSGATQTRGWLPRNPAPSAIQVLGWPLDGTPERRLVRLAFEQVRPAIHLAHRLRGPVVVPPRVVLDHEIVLVLEGQGEIAGPDDVQGLAPGDLLMLPPFVPHRLHGRSPDFEHIAIHFSLSPELPALNALHAQDPYRLVVEDDRSFEGRLHLDVGDTLRAAIERIVGLWGDDTPLATFEAEALLMTAVAQLLHRLAMAKTSSLHAIDPRVATALREIEFRVTRPPRIPELAAAAGLGITRFNVLFRAWTNETPAAYIRRCRLMRACASLEQSDEPVKVVALSHGFRDAAHFSRVFFKQYGRWPTEYRRVHGLTRSSRLQSASEPALDAVRSDAAEKTNDDFGDNMSITSVLRLHRAARKRS